MDLQPINELTCDSVFPGLLDHVAGSRLANAKRQISEQSSEKEIPTGAARKVSTANTLWPASFSAAASPTLN
jgi:hypothetical protein